LSVREYNLRLTKVLLAAIAVSAVSVYATFESYNNMTERHKLCKESAKMTFTV